MSQEMREEERHELRRVLLKVLHWFPRSRIQNNRLYEWGGA